MDAEAMAAFDIHLGRGICSGDVGITAQNVKHSSGYIFIRVFIGGRVETATSVIIWGKHHDMPSVPWYRP